MADLEAVMNAIKDALETIDDLQVLTTGSQPTPPTAQIEPGRVMFDGAMSRGHEKWEFIIRILVSTASEESAHLEVFKYFGQAKDIKDALESYVPLKDGTAAHDVFVRNAEDFGTWDVQGVAYRGVQFNLDVYV